MKKMRLKLAVGGRVPSPKKDSCGTDAARGGKTPRETTRAKSK
jgi:hypothetical protein